VITKKRLYGAGASVRLLRGPFDTRPDYLQVCVRFGFLRLYTHHYNIIYMYYVGLAVENAVISWPHNVCLCLRTKVFADNPIKCRPCKVYINII